MSIKVRKAIASDVHFLAKMILQSSRAGKQIGIFDVIFDTKSNEEILKKIESLVQTKAKNHCHLNNFLVADVDGKSVGTLCSYEPRIATKKTFLDALAEIGYDDVENRLEVLYTCNFNLNNRTLMFDFMEELDDFKEVGIVKELMRKSLLTARLKGYRIAQTIIEIGSLESMLFYKKLGFKELEERECELYKEKFGRPGLVLLSTEF